MLLECVSGSVAGFRYRRQTEKNDTSGIQDAMMGDARRKCRVNWTAFPCEQLVLRLGKDRGSCSQCLAPRKVGIETGRVSLDCRVIIIMMDGHGAGMAYSVGIL